MNINTPNVGLHVASAIFAVVATAHAWRALHAVEVVIDGTMLPMWVSIVGFVVTGGLCVWMGTLARRK